MPMAPCAQPQLRPNSACEPIMLSAPRDGAFLPVLGHHQQHPLRHGLAQVLEEIARQVRLAPLAVWAGGCTIRTLSAVWLHMQFLCQGAVDWHQGLRHQCEANERWCTSVPGRTVLAPGSYNITMSNEWLLTESQEHLRC